MKEEEEEEDNNNNNSSNKTTTTTPTLAQYAEEWIRKNSGRSSVKSLKDDFTLLDVSSWGQRDSDDSSSNNNNNNKNDDDDGDDEEYDDDDDDDEYYDTSEGFITPLRLRVGNETLRVLQYEITTSTDGTPTQNSRKHSELTKPTTKKQQQQQQTSSLAPLNLNQWIIRKSESKMHVSEEVDRFFDDLIRTEFPKCDIPTLRQVINVGKSREGKARYHPGEWVEIRGLDMRWRLDMITRVVKQAPIDFDWNDPANEGKQPPWKYFYHCGSQRMLEADELRSPEEGLIHIFGHRPWVWQQWAILKLEQSLRYQKGHQNDFISKDTDKFAKELWDQWLNHPSNADFRSVFYDDRIGDFGRMELIHHITKPFRLVEKVAQDDELWNFMDDKDISVYTYLGVFGSGFCIPLIVLALQIIIPLLLFKSTCIDIDNAKEEDDHDHQSWSITSFHILNTQCFRQDMFKLFQNTSEGDTAETMVLVVLLLYLVWIVPNNFVSFYNILGSKNTTYSKITSLRHNIWRQNDDRIGQMIGFKMDLYMNTAYVCLLYMLNIFIIINTNDTLEIILNALAFEFISQIDEDVTFSDWWDPDRRWIIAGTVELVLQNSLRLRWLQSPNTFSTKFNIPKEILYKACDNDSNLFSNIDVAENDEADTRFMTSDEIVKYQCRESAIRLQNGNAIDEYLAPVVTFSAFDQLIQSLLPSRRRTGIFKRFSRFRTWSRWERVLFLSPMPNLDYIFFTDKKRGKTFIRRKLDSIKPTMEKPFANFELREQNVSYLRLFIRHVWNVLRFHYMIIGLHDSWQTKKYMSFVFRLVDGIVQWIAYVIQFVFPIYVVVAVIGTFYSVGKHD